MQSLKSIRPPEVDNYFKQSFEQKTLIPLYFFWFVNTFYNKSHASALASSPSSTERVLLELKAWCTEHSQAEVSKTRSCRDCSWSSFIFVWSSSQFSSLCRWEVSDFDAEGSGSAAIRRRNYGLRMLARVWISLGWYWSADSRVTPHVQTLEAGAHRVWDGTILAANERYTSYASTRSEPVGCSKCIHVKTRSLALKLERSIELQAGSSDWWMTMGKWKLCLRCSACRRSSSSISLACFKQEE